MSNPGHNSGKGGPVNANRLKSFIERIEKLEEERKAIGGDIKDVYSEAKGVGYDVGTMRKVVRLRAMDAAARAEQETLLDVYWHALQTVDRIDERLAAGESQREVAAAEGVSKSTVQRRGPKVESAPASSKMDHHNPETGEITTPEDGGDGITESCGGAALRVDETVRADQPGPHDAFEQELDRVYGPDDEAPATPSVGAVAREPATERVASSSDDDDLDIPAHLRGPSPANRRVA